MEKMGETGNVGRERETGMREGKWVFLCLFLFQLSCFDKKKRTTISANNEIILPPIK